MLCVMPARNLLNTRFMHLFYGHYFWYPDGSELMEVTPETTAINTKLIDKMIIRNTKFIRLISYNAGYFFSPGISVILMTHCFFFFRIPDTFDMYGTWLLLFPQTKFYFFF